MDSITGTDSTVRKPGLPQLICLLTDETISDQSRQLGGIPAERLNGGGEHLGLTDVFPRDVIVVCLGKMADEFALCSAVAFTEGMQSAYSYTSANR
jgi:hypothetical protein